MAERVQDEKALDLETSSIDELERSAIFPAEPGPTSAVEDPTLKGPQVSRRCDSSHRELLKNQFPSDV